MNKKSKPINWRRTKRKDDLRPLPQVAKTPLHTSKQKNKQKYLK